MSQPTVSVKVWSEYALFSRPELSVERISYPLMTPSAARGVLDAILYKPQMNWHVRRISVLRPVTLPSGFSTIEAQAVSADQHPTKWKVMGTIAPGTVQGWMKNPGTFEPYLVDSAGREGAQGQNRTQRNSLILHHVAYRIDASPKLTERANQPRLQPEDEEDHGPDYRCQVCCHVSTGALPKGQCFHRPYLGVREFACQFAPADEAEKPIVWDDSLGFMLYDIRFLPDGVKRPGFFDARIANGILHCDTESKGPNQEPPITVHGWSDLEEKS